MTVMANDGWVTKFCSTTVIKIQLDRKITIKGKIQHSNVSKFGASVFVSLLIFVWLFKNVTIQEWEYSRMGIFKNVIIQGFGDQRSG